MKSHLKVKVFALSAEMTYIRRQEIKWKKRAQIARQRQREFIAADKLKDATSEAIIRGREHILSYAENNFWTHRWHREELKKDARNSHLAYGCMRGTPYSKMEHICYGVFKGYGSTEPDWQTIEWLVERFSKDEPVPQDFMQRFSEWLAEAKKWYEGNQARIILAAEERVKRRLDRDSDPAYQDSLAFTRKEAERMGRLAALTNALKIAETLGKAETKV